ncbi:hypothetical protein DICVIV_11173 [Dictyocaulus viviparus]|uniref:Oxidation resistance protein 1 n=1 Tax=Dictyocaulus viviparus TaxID=29172 RepID=A0A0D8XDZ9_DICVI|nr:hypothetical protein DICVIV_11173 [Dictyocaulus viviparus]
MAQVPFIPHPIESRRRSATVNTHANNFNRVQMPRLSVSQCTMTPYEVKLLMKSFEHTMERSKESTTYLTENEAEGKLMGQIHDQFASQPQLLSKLKFGVFNCSEDSGIHDMSYPVSMTNMALKSISSVPKSDNEKGSTNRLLSALETQENTILTPLSEKKTVTNYNLSKPKLRRFLPKRVFNRTKHNERQRSKSLGSSNFIGGGDQATPLFGSSLLNREWEIVTVREICRRLSLDEMEHLEMPIPEGASQSQILDELMVRQIMEILPPRAEGYPWVSIYNSEKNGFSLNTLYRQVKMVDFDEDLSPVLLIIRDTHEHVFGAVVSGAIRPCDHYTGTGDSTLLWRFLGEVPHTRELRHYNWTGDNQFFVNAAKDSLSIGAGGGHCGLWLDADLNHGRSQRCSTFDNEPLAGEKEDFVVQFIEAFGFRM